MAFRPFKVIQGHRFCYHLKARICDFLLVRYSNLGPILHRFRDIAGFCADDPHPYTTLILGCSRCTRSPMVGSISERTLSYSAVKLFSKYSNLCDEVPSYLNVTHGQTDRRHTVATSLHRACVRMPTTSLPLFKDRHRDRQTNRRTTTQTNTVSRQYF